MEEKLSTLHSAKCPTCGCDQLFDARGKCMQCEIKFSAEVRPEIKVRRCKTRIRRTQRAGSRVEGEGNNSPFAQHNVNLETGEI